MKVTSVDRTLFSDLIVGNFDKCFFQQMNRNETNYSIEMRNKTRAVFFYIFMTTD